MSDEPRTARRTGGRAGRQAARLAAAPERVPFITRTLPPFEVLDDDGIELIENNADTILEQVGIDFRGAPDALKLLKEAGADVRRRARAVPSRDVPRADPGDRPAGVHAVRAQPREQRPDRRQRHGPGARLRVAVRPRPGRWTPVRHDRGLPQLREARVRDAVPPSLRRNGLRARRPAGEQAALRHGLRAHAVLGQAVHGLGHASAARAGHGGHGADPLRQGLPGGPRRGHEPDQRELTARVGLHHAGRRTRVRAGEPGRDHDAVHPGRAR